MLFCPEGDQINTPGERFAKLFVFLFIKSITTIAMERNETTLHNKNQKRSFITHSLSWDKSIFQSFFVNPGFIYPPGKYLFKNDSIYTSFCRKLSRENNFIIDLNDISLTRKSKKKREYGPQIEEHNPCTIYGL